MSRSVKVLQKGIQTIILGLIAQPVFGLADDVCTTSAYPPFIDAGVTPNLLMLIDNSGSMLDMAYLDKTTYQDVLLDKNDKVIGSTEYQNTCLDKSYLYEDGGIYNLDTEVDTRVPNSGRYYEGYFERDKWYQWDEPDGRSGLDLTGVKDWPELYEGNASYAVGEIVTYQGMLYKAKAVTDVINRSTFDYSQWDHFDGHFKQVELLTGEKGEDLACKDFSSYPTYYYIAPTTTNTDEDGNLVTTLAHTDLKIAFDLVEDPTEVHCFAATGNFLNWVMDSKFDIQKKILTGGKFYEGVPPTPDNPDTKNINEFTPNSDDDLLISEHRGCSDKGFTKEISLNFGPTGTTTGTINDKTLVLRVRGPQEAFNDSLDPVDATIPYDFTTRLDILGISTTGGVNFSYCNAYLEELAKDQPQLPTLERYMEGCLYGDQAGEVKEVYNIYHSSIHDCWKIATGKPPVHSGNLAAQCLKVYQGYEQGQEKWEQKDPWEITPWNPEYICYGKWDDDRPPSLTNSFRAGDSESVGYIGRCWEDWPIVTIPGDPGDPDTIETCVQKTCDCSDSVWEETVGTACYADIGPSNAPVGNSCVGGVQFECGNGEKLANTDPPTCKDTPGGGAGNWERIFVVEDDNTTPCETDTSSGGETKNSCYDGSTYNQGCWGTVNAGWDSQDAKDCRTQAEWDYCSELSLTNTIDPSDLGLTATDDSSSATWGVVAALVDSAVFNQLGVNAPMMTMKGYVEYINHLSSDDMKAEHLTGRPYGPRGVLYNYANDIRFGVMKLRELGSKAECDQWRLICGELGTDIDSQYCIARRNLGDYCNEVDLDYDGAKVMTPIADTVIENPDETENWYHFKTVVGAINDAQATAWTPLAEAVYAALGYYGQNPEMRLHPSLDPDTGDPATSPDQTADFLTATETTDQTWADPVQHWCQENNFLIISEGSSTSDINSTVADFVNSNPDGVAFDGGTDSACSDGLEGSTYFDDLTWFAQHSEVTGTSEDAPSSSFYKKLIEKFPDDVDNDEYEKQPVTTHLITSGSLRGNPAGDECEPIKLMTDAAINGASAEMLAIDSDPLLQGERPEALKTNLEQALQSMLNRASAGSAASVISSSRSGEGAVYQAVFWPEIERNENEAPLTWVGDVHALFIDDMGQLWDDSDPDGKLTRNDDGDGILEAGESCDGDRRIFYDFNAAQNTTSICFYEGCPGPASGTVCTNRQTSVDIEDFNDYLWSANQVLGSIVVNSTTNDLKSNRRYDSDGLWEWYNSAPTRYIFTWNDLNNDGIVNSANNFDEIIELHNIDDVGNATDWLDYQYVSGTTPDIHHNLLDDFRVATEPEMKNLVDWLRGIDVQTAAGDYIYRCRKYDPTQTDPGCYTFSTDPVGTTDNPEWRLGDIVHSTPKLVSQPAEAFHTIYRDPSYANFVQRWRYRRNMVYFGANDGMLHAVNAGFYGPYLEPDDSVTFKFWRNLEGILSENRCYYNSSSDTYAISDSSCDTVSFASNSPLLGTEMWAYIPYNLQPHLIKLTQPDYGEYHEYFVDKEPRIFDMKIFPQETACGPDAEGTPLTPFDEGCIHPGGWGTVLVGAMRFGGHPIVAQDEANWSDAYGAGSGIKDNRKFISAYFVLDITNPEGPPTLLGETTMTVDVNGDPVDNKGTTDASDDVPLADMGFSVSLATGTVMRDVSGSGVSKTANSYWYLVLGSGPYTYDGENPDAVAGKIAVMPMSWLFDDSPSDSTEDRIAFRIPANKPDTGSFDEGGVFEIPDSPSFVSDLITADLDIQTPSDPDFGGLYKSDAVYFGTVDGTGFTVEDLDGDGYLDNVDEDKDGNGSFDVLTEDLDGDGRYDDGAESDVNGNGILDPASVKFWNGGGRVFRLVMRTVDEDIDLDGDSVPDILDDGDGLQESLPPSGWYLSSLMDTTQPVTGAPSLGWDGANYWIYFGTGRFYSTQDKTDTATNYFFGVKEPLDSSCEMNWNEIVWRDGVGPITHSPDSGSAAGTRGLFRSDYVDVFTGGAKAGSSDQIFTIDGDAVVFCESGGECYFGPLDDVDNISVIDDTTVNVDLYRFKDLQTYISGPSRGVLGDPDECAFDAVDPDLGFTPGVDGWYRVLRDERERVVGQSTLLGGLTTFTSYQPFEDVCTPEGQSFLYGVHYQTGTSWYENVFGITTEDNLYYDYGGSIGVQSVNAGTVNERVSLGRGLATTPSLHVSSQSDAEAKAFIQTSTGEILEIDQENLPIKPPRSGRIFWSDDRNPYLPPE